MNRTVLSGVVRQVLEDLFVIWVLGSIPFADEKISVAESDNSRSQAVQYGLLFLAWAVPGLGHFSLGRRGRGTIFLLLSTVSLLIGWSLNGNLYRIVPDQPLSVLATLGSMGVGAFYFVLRFALGYQGEVTASTYEVGSAFILTAGLMNLLVIIDVWDLIRGRKV